jgi:dihydrodipicolinate synthase/N-acetylneuraminate lyase
VTLTRTSLSGVWGTVLLPLDDRDRIEWNRLEAQVDRLAASSLDGVYAHGTAGEFHTLAGDEFDRITAVLRAACDRHGKPFQVGASHPVAGTTIERITRARAYGPDAFQVILPDWLRLTDAECESFLRGVARAAAPAPLVLYNPPHAKTLVGPALMSRLLDSVPELIGCKIAGGDADWYAAMKDVLDACAVFVPGHTLASGVARGARGSYSNVAALSPDGAAEWFRTMRTDPAGAADLEFRIGTLFARHIAPLERQGFSAPALDKFLAVVGGWTDVGLRIRWPYESVPAERVGPARDTAREQLPELLGRPGVLW